MHSHKRLLSCILRRTTNRPGQASQPQGARFCCPHRLRHGSLDRVSTTDFLDTDPFEAARTAADYIASETGVEAHDTALVLGSGWAEAADLIGETTATLAASEVPGFSAPAVEGHVGTIRSVLTREGKRALVHGARTRH